MVKSSSHNVVVGVRIRPLNAYEEEHSPEIAWEADGEKKVVQVPPSDGSKIHGKPEYPFDHVFGPESTTDQLYARLGQPIVDGAFDGYNGTVRQSLAAFVC